MKPIVGGWITIPECELVAKYMTKTKGRILETGAATGKLFSYLHQFFPQWEYHAVDPWEKAGQMTCKDWEAPYEPSNWVEPITQQMFQDNCPFAKAHPVFFEQVNSHKKFDVISMGLMGSQVDYFVSYEKAGNMLADNGVIIGRDLDHRKHGPTIKQAIENFELIETVDSGNTSFVLKNK